MLFPLLTRLPLLLTGQGAVPAPWLVAFVRAAQSSSRIVANAIWTWVQYQKFPQAMRIDGVRLAVLAWKCKMVAGIWLGRVANLTHLGKQIIERRTPPGGAGEEGGGKLAGAGGCGFETAVLDHGLGTQVPEEQGGEIAVGQDDAVLAGAARFDAGLFSAEMHAKALDDSGDAAGFASAAGAQLDSQLGGQSYVFLLRGPLGKDPA